MAAVNETTDPTFFDYLSVALHQAWIITPTYSHMIFSALLPIFCAAHAALRRPTNCSTEKPEPDDSMSENEDEDEEQDVSQVETLSASDALVFPVMAGVVLGSLYIIIKYLKMHELLNLFMHWYMCFFGIFAVGKAASDFGRVLVSFVFPQMWRAKGGKVFAAAYNSWKAGDGEELRDPRPLGIRLPEVMWNEVWKFSRGLRARWCIKYRALQMRKISKSQFWIGDVLGPLFGSMTVAVYTMGGKHWSMTNIIGTSLSYSALQIMSPTTFSIGSLLLGLLFVYDVVMVFYTPMMVTVATTLDVPIKLVFPRPGQAAQEKARNYAMLGLGDVVIPGLIIVMALRYDLWRFYEKKRLALVKAAGEEVDDEIKKTLKPAYTNATGGWGEAWYLRKSSEFDKTYFKASMWGYVIGMIATLIVMHVFQHAQPALLYLVPCVLGAVWGTALVRGEVKQTFEWSEEGEPQEEKEEEKEVIQKEEDDGEKEKEYLSIHIIRKPARGAKKRIVGITAKEEEESDNDESESSLSLDSSESGEVVEKP